MPSEVWIAACAHRLHRQWHSVDPDDLEQVASMLLRDGRFAAMAPDEAAAEWLKPIAGGAPRESGNSMPFADSRSWPE